MTLEDLYQQHCRSGTAIAAHLPRLRTLAAGLQHVAEFGVKNGASSTALLLGAQYVTSFDIVETPHARALQKIAGDRWSYVIADSREVQHVQAELPTELLFIDSLHTHAQVQIELARHAHHVTRYLVFHDVTTFGEVGAVGETGKQSWTYQHGRSVPPEHYGIRPAIDELMIRDDSWRIKARYVDSHGLLVLERR